MDSSHPDTPPHQPQSMAAAQDAEAAASVTTPTQLYEPLVVDTAGPSHLHHVETPISIDSNDDDSAIADLSYLSSTTSANASVFDYVKENGRTYHRFREGKYMLPNDQVEQDRLDMQHQMWLLTLNGHLSLAPLKQSPHRVLDIGTGTGIWAMDYALEHPSAIVIGNDLSPIQPIYVPPNCTFEIEDVEDTWTYDTPFSLIHGRLMLSCFSNAKAVFAQALTHLAPGGYLEMQDGDFPARCADTTYTGTKLEAWNNSLVQGAANVGRPLTGTRLYAQWMREVGFVNVEERLFRWPINTWPKDPHLKKLGFWFQANLLELINSTRAILTKGLGWGAAEIDPLLEGVRIDLDDRGVHAYHVMYVVYGMKPE